MTVKELIEHLKKCNENAEVVVADCVSDLIDYDSEGINKVIEFCDISNDDEKTVGLIIN